MKGKESKFSLVIILAVVILVLIASADLFAGPGTLNRDEIPDKYKWNLNDIYSGWEAWEKDLALIETKMDEYTALKGTLTKGPEQLLKAFLLNDELGMLAYKIYRYPGLMNSIDTRNNDVAARLQQVHILFSKFNTATAWFNPELLTIPWDTMTAWLDQTKKLEPYRHDIEDLYRQQEHVLNEDQERLLSYFSPFNGTPTNIYTELSTSDIKFGEVTLSDGKNVTVTEGKYQNILATSRNQEDRKKAFEALYNVYNDQVNTYAAVYNSVLQRDWAMAQARNYNSALEASLDGDNVPVNVFENLVSTVKSNTEPVKRYMRLRKEKLGLDTYHLYDGRIPIVDFNKTYEYDDITDWIFECVEPLGKEYQKKVKTTFSGGRIDIYENEGKTSGAFSAGVYGVHPYILLNYQETLNDVFTLVHEVGHSIHTILSQENQPFATSGYSIFVAEVASTVNEALLLDYLLKRSNDPLERIALLQQAIDNVVGTFYSQVMFSDFEWQAHKLVEQGRPITADVLKRLYLDMEEEYYGDAVKIDNLYGCLWARIGHFYWAPYYVYKYSTSFATSAQIAKNISSKDEKVRKETLNRYLTLLKSGGNDYPIELLKKAGVDLTQPEPVLAVINNLDYLVTQLETELAKL